MHAHTIARSSFSIVLYTTVPCDKIAPKATLEASVVKMNGLEKSGYCKMGALVNKFLQVLNEA
mgnify:CR=1 FL=1